MWWKIYFWITILEAFLNILSLFSEPGMHIFTQVVLLVLFLIAVTGLYGYIYQKKFLTPIFWQYFLGIYFLIDLVYLIYSIVPHALIVSYLSFLSIYPSDKYSLINALFGVAIDIPLMVALYRFGKGHLFEPKEKNNKKNVPYKWGMLQMALWGYSFVLTFFLFILSLIPASSRSGTKGHEDVYSLTFVTVLFAPLLLFWLWVILHYKKYRWNWWRMTLIANAVLYSGSIIFGVLLPPTAPGASSFDIISALQLFILFLSLYVFGRGQFK